MTTRAEHRASAERHYRATIEGLQVLHTAVQAPEGLALDAEIQAAVATSQASAQLGLIQAVLALSAPEEEP